MGLPCVFVRLTGCDIGCTYCDTKGVAKAEGTSMTVNEIIKKVDSFNCNLVEVTGGEPLQQKGVFSLLTDLCDAGYQTLLETSGQEPVEQVDPRVEIIMDIKTPGSGVASIISRSNVDILREKHVEIKFVVTSKEDFEFALLMEQKYNLTKLFPVLISAVEGLDKREVANWILSSKIPFRLQLQLHKIIWPNALGER